MLWQSKHGLKSLWISRPSKGNRDRRVWRSWEFHHLTQKPCFSLYRPLFPHHCHFSLSPLLMRSRTHSVLLSVQSTKRGQRGSMSVRQVVTQMMTNWPPLRLPPNQVQTWLSCAHGSYEWRSMALRWSSQFLSLAPPNPHSVTAM